MLQRAAQANSVRELEGECCDVGEAGLSLRDITYMKTHASRAREIEVIIVGNWYNIRNEVS